MSQSQEIIARLWARFQPLARERVALIAAYLDGGEAPTADGAAQAVHAAHAAARQAAHDLVGSLGSYGHPEGSVLARRLETLLGSTPDAMGAAERTEARDLVAALDREVAG